MLRWSRRDRVVPRSSRYWQPQPAAGVRGQRAASTTSSPRPGALLEASVRSRLLADVPLGVFLSGGLDSTLIAALAAKVSAASDQDLHRRLRRRRGQRDRRGGDGRPRELGAGAPRAGADPGRARPAGPEPARRDGPAARRPGAGLAARDRRARAARRHRRGRRRGRRRALRRLSALPLALARPSGSAGGCPRRSRPGSPPPSRRAPHARAARVADVLEPRERCSSGTSTGSPRRAARCASRSTARRCGAACRPAASLDDLAARLDGAAAAPVMARLMVLDQLHWLPDDVLVKADRAGMRVSLEIRTPYLNRELAEFAGDGARPGPRRARRQGAAASPARAGRARDGRPAAAQDGVPRARRRLAARAAGAAAGPAARRREPRSPRAGSTATARRASSREHRSGSRDASSALWPLLAFGLWLDRVRG